MFFKRKIDRVLDVKGIEERSEGRSYANEMEKGDLPAMIIAGLLVLGIPMLLVIGIVTLIPAMLMG